MPPELTEDQKKELERRMRRSACCQKILATDDGKVLYDEVMEFCGMFSGISDDFDSNPYKNAYKSGRKSVGMFFNNMLKGNVEKAKEMLANAKR